MASVLIVDDDGELVTILARSLKLVMPDVIISGASNQERALAFLEEHHPAVVVLDLNLVKALGVESGFALLTKIRTLDPSVRVIVQTGNSGVEHGIRALRLGAASFLAKPSNVEHLAALVRDGIAQAELRRTVFRLEESSALSNIAGTSSAIASLKAQLKQASRHRMPVLLVGETGTGKGVAARAIHALSASTAAPFIRYQTAYNTPDLVASDLFGHSKGAFTGAEQRRLGLLSQADNGTFFLDEVDALPSQTQVALLGVLQDRVFRPLGDSQEHSVHCRWISATNADLTSKIETKEFRSDLFHRIAHVVIHIPPLRDRLEDIPLLVNEIKSTIEDRDGTFPIPFSPEAIARLQSYDWPGNIRELEAVVERSIYAALGSESLIVESNDLFFSSQHTPMRERGLSFHVQVENFKRKLVRDALIQNEHNQVKAAKALQMDRSSMRRLLD